MAKPLNEQHAEAARRALDAASPASKETLHTRITDLIIGLGHLCSGEQIEFLPAVEKAIGHWVIERIDPMSVHRPPAVTIFVDRKGLPPLPERKRRS